MSFSPKQLVDVGDPRLVSSSGASNGARSVLAERPDASTLPGVRRLQSEALRQEGLPTKPRCHCRRSARAKEARHAAERDGECCSARIARVSV